MLKRRTASAGFFSQSGTIKFNDVPTVLFKSYKPNIIVQLILMIVRSLRVDGFRITWDKICKKLGILQ